jgi:Domain of unknown function (DUF1996)
MMERVATAVGHVRLNVILVAVALLAVVGGGTAAGLAVTLGSANVGALPAGTKPATHRNLPTATTTPTSAVPATSTPEPPSSAPSSPPEPATGNASGATTSNLISDTCLYSHEANDDPILQPGMPGQSMAHDFFGNVTTSATSTASGLVGGPTSCTTRVDASAYWTPVLYQHGVAITPERNLVYWTGLQAKSQAVSAPPAGLEMIAGDEGATAPQSTRVIDWRCAEQTTTTQPVSAAPVNCAGTNGIELRITFPSCWNGTSLSGATQTNVVYPTKGAVCPPGHSVRIPTVIFHVVYPITSAAGITLSMGPGQQGSVDTAHGDFINGWNQSVLSGLISGCAGTTHTCGHVTGPDAHVRPGWRSAHGYVSI